MLWIHKLVLEALIFWKGKKSTKCINLLHVTVDWPVSHSAYQQRPARERHKIHITSRENVDNQRRAIHILHNSMFQFTFKCGYNNFISKYTNINSLHVTQINLLHNDNFCSTLFTRFKCKKGSLRVHSVIILVVLSTHAELAIATVRGRSYWETGGLQTTDNTLMIRKNNNNKMSLFHF